MPGDHLEFRAVGYKNIYIFKQFRRQSVGRRWRGIEYDSHSMAFGKPGRIGHSLDRHLKLHKQYTGSDDHPRHRFDV